MCGLTGFWFKESVPDPDIIKNLVNYGEKRGSDGFGYVTWSYDTDFPHRVDRCSGVDDPFTTGDLAISRYWEDRKNSILLCNHRAAPETEASVSSNKRETLQPLETKDLLLVHNGTVSNFIYNELKKDASVNTKLDSEAIIWAYTKFGRNMKKTMEYLSGGFAFLMVDKTKRKLYAVCTHGPLYCGYVRGYGMFWSSMEEAIWDTISSLKGTTIDRHNISVFEDYYCRMVPANTIEEIDIDSGQINELKFTPRYVTSTWDNYLRPKVDPKYGEWKGEDKELDSPTVLVAASSGLDSTTTMAVLQECGYTPVAVHFKYGHRGQDAEELGIKYITSEMGIPLKIVDIEHIMKDLDKGMLTDKNAPIITGTVDGLKTTAAWTTWRNGFFLSHMAAIAESLIMKYNLPLVYLTGGFLQLTESGVYHDNSERFLKSFMQFNKFASLCGNRVKPMYGLCNILKSEQYALLEAVGELGKLSPYMVSCDRPIVKDGQPHNCSKNGLPACGSGLLSYWGSKIAGVEDTRNYYEVDDEFNGYASKSDLTPKYQDINKIIDKLEIPEFRRRLLRDSCKDYVADMLRV